MKLRRLGGARRILRRVIDLFIVNWEGRILGDGFVLAVLAEYVDTDQVSSVRFCFSDFLIGDFHDLI